MRPESPHEEAVSDVLKSAWVHHYRSPSDATRAWLLIHRTAYKAAHLEIAHELSLSADDSARVLEVLRRCL